MSSAEALAMMRADVPERLDGEAFAALERLLADRDASGGARARETVLERARLAGDALEHLGVDVEVRVHRVDVVEVLQRVDQRASA